MTHPITPPPELVQEWAHLFIDHTDTEVFSAVAQWGADQELEACCAIALTDPVCGTKHQRSVLVRHMREQRRPKPQSLKEQALDELHISFDRGYLKKEAADTIRRALEQLDD